jgi:hypothetical protein
MQMPTWNRTMLYDCLDSLRAIADPSVDIVVAGTGG